MWSIEKFGAVRGRGRQATPRSYVFQNQVPWLVFSDAIPRFLTEAGSQTELTATYSKQRGGSFLTETRTASGHSSKFSQFTLAHGSTGLFRDGLVLATGHRPILTQEGALARLGFRYNAPARISPARLAT